jgi:hypothetical protein
MLSNRPCEKSSDNRRSIAHSGPVNHNSVPSTLLSRKTQLALFTNGQTDSSTFHFT